MEKKNPAGTPEKPLDTWAKGKIYESFIGRWSRPVAVEFLDWLGQPAGLRWLDLGCGTGALSQAILNKANPAKITGMDSSAGFVSLATHRIKDKRVQFVVGDVRKLPFTPAYFDVAVSGLVLNFIPNPGLALTGIQRVIKPGGKIAVYVWDYAGRMEMLRYFWDAAVSLDSRAASLDEGTRFKLCSPEGLEKVFKEAGLEAVEVRAIEVPTIFSNFNDYWEPFLGGQGPAPGYVATLDETHKRILKDQLKQILPTGPADSIHLTARAWAVRGTKPD